MPGHGIRSARYASAYEPHPTVSLQQTPYVGAGLRPALGQVVGKRECVVLRTDLRHAKHGSGLNLPLQGNFQINSNLPVPSIKSPLSPPFAKGETGGFRGVS